MLPQAPVCDAGGMPSPPPRPAIPRAIPRAIWVLGFVSMLMDISSEMVHSLLPVFMVTALGASAFTVGLIEGAGEATALIVKLVSGTWSDRMGRRKPLAVAGYALGALSKPLFALAGSTGMVLGARLMDRVGKGLRGAPRDALVADIAPPEVRGAAFGLRQSLDTVGAFLGPLLAMGLMLLWHNDFQAIFWVAIVPGLMAVALLALGVREPARVPAATTSDTSSATSGGLGTPGRLGIPALPAACWWVVALGGVFTLARVSEAFLVLRAQHAGLGLAWTPLVLIATNLVYALAAYPMGRLADRVAPQRLLALGMGVLVGADLLLAWGQHGLTLAAGVLLFGLHMAMTQGVLATLVAATAPPTLRGTAFGWFNLVSGVAMLVSGAAAGLLWDHWGPASTFLSSALLALGALALLAWIGRARAAQPDAAT